MSARAFVKGHLCHACRYGVLETFAAVAGVSIGPLQATRAPIGRGNRRHFSTAPLRLGQQQPPLGDFKVLTDGKDLGRDEEPGPQQAKAEEVVPWYLQEEIHEKSSHPLAHRQRIPDLPENPPPLLQGLLRHISVDIGLDDLSLLDLREMDPPPALGSKLLMIIGTARSEKHLNVSADRLCRWLRSTHKLRPYADGLLGRNELKLKLKRKARRAKLMSSVGASMKDNIDDGITTGWICVNVGEVPSGVEMQEPSQPEGFVGFGKHFGGAKIVIQMLTEEKRAELDLEGLWGNVLESDGISEAEDRHVLEQEAPQQHVRLAPKLPLGPTADFGGSPRSPNTRNYSGYIQGRNYTTFTGEKKRAEVAEENLEYEGLDELTLEPQLSAEEALYDIPDHASADITLRSLLKYLEERPRATTISQIGAGHLDRDSTQVLRRFYRAIANVPGHERQDWLLRFYALGMRLTHPGYPKDLLLAQLREMRLSENPISEKALSNVVRALLAPVTRDGSVNESNSVSMPIVPLQNINDAMEIVEDMKSRGFTTSMEDMFLMLHEAVASNYLIAPEAILESADAGSAEDSTSVEDQYITKLQELQNRLYDTMDTLGVDWSTDQLYMKVMQLHADVGHWDGFWRLWSQISLRLRPRSKELYAFMFQNIARSSNQKRCIDAIERYLPIMEYEEPPVEVDGEVARSVMECLMVIEPGIERSDFSGEASHGKWLDLWQRALEGWEKSQEHEASNL